MSSPDMQDSPSPFNYCLSFLLVGAAWGLTTPFMRRAAKDHNPPPRPLMSTPAVRNSWIKTKVYGAFFAAVDLLSNPRYALPLVVNLTGGIWFFLLIGQAELSLTVPIVNTLGLLFTILGEWWVENKIVSKQTALGVAISLSGIALCVVSKS